MIQCVGSRNEDNPNCSRVCCQGAVKHALELKELNPDMEIIILYRDMRAYGFSEDYYREAADKDLPSLSERAHAQRVDEVRLGEQRLDVDLAVFTAQRGDQGVHLGAYGIRRGIHTPFQQLPERPSDHHVPQLQTAAARRPRRPDESSA